MPTRRLYSCQACNIIKTLFQSEKGYHVQLTAELVASMPSCWMLTVSLHNLTLDEYIQEQESLNVHIHELYRRSTACTMSSTSSTWTNQPESLCSRAMP